MNYVASLTVNNDVILAGDRCITSLRELYECILYKDTYLITINKDFAEEYFTPTGLQDFVDNVKTINSKVTIKVNSVMSMFDDKSVKTLMDVKNMEEFIYMLHKRPKDTIDTIHTLGNFYLNSRKETLVANDKIATLHLENTSLRKRYDDLKKSFNSLMEIKNEYEARLKTLVARINFKYNKDLHQEAMFNVTGSKFDKILYIKELTRVHYTDTLVYYLQEILKTFYGVPARLVVIGPYYAYGGSKMYPMCKPHFDLTYNDVYKENIYMAGLQQRLMSDILSNPYNINYLIVLDRSGCEKPFVTGDGVEVVCTVSDINDMEGSKFPTDRMISYSESSLHIPFISGFSILSTEERMQKYSSMPIMKRLLDLIERK